VADHPSDDGAYVGIARDECGENEATLTIGENGYTWERDLFFRQFAFPHNALMLFACALDAVFELPSIVRELFGHFVGSARHIATDCA
jgi:hypothetical protein